MPSIDALLTFIRQQRIVPAVLLAVILLAIVNWTLSPEQAQRWLRGMLILPGFWLILVFWHFSTLRSVRRRGIEDESGIRRYFGATMALLFIAVGFRQIVVLGLEIWVALGDRQSSLDVERRILGLASCAVFVFIGNALPKILTPLSMLPRQQAELVTVARRFVGKTFVVLGLATALAFLSAPLDIAAKLLGFAAAVGFLTILGAVVWMNVSAARPKG
jgi:hypothetical protein